MDFLEEELEEILNIFREESEEHLQKINQCLLNLEANPKDAEIRAQELYNAGIRTFRVYDARTKGGAMVETVKKLRDMFGDTVTIIAGQVINPDQAIGLQEAGADAIVIGIGEGGICKTPKEASLVASNVMAGYKIAKKGLNIPLIFDSGVGPRTPVAIALGGGAVMKSQALVGSVIEKPPFCWWWWNKGRYESQYSGEAAERTKHLGHKVGPDGEPTFVEGVDEVTYFNEEVPSIASNIYYLLQSLVTASVFQRVGDLDDLRLLKKVKLWTQTGNAVYSTGVHHNGSKQ